MSAIEWTRRGEANVLAMASSPSWTFCGDPTQQTTISNLRITLCYGSLTTFNILFKNKDDQFRTSAVDRPTG